MSLRQGKKAQMEQLGTLATGIATLAIVLVVTFLIMSQGRTQLETLEGACNISDGTNCGYGTNATITLQGAVDDIPGWVPLIVIASIGAILLGLVALFNRNR
tara:strand:- start:560 stop:865 length:306 start_codon:yes stop_codon:yes gene_type:complete